MSLAPLFALALGATVAAALALLVEDEVRVDSSPGLVVGVFGTFLTSTSIIAAFSIEGKSRWPTPWEMLDRARVTAWFLVGLVSVVVALVGAAIDNAFLGAYGLALALVGLLLGAWGLRGLFSLSSDRGRHALVVDRLAASIRGSDPVPRDDDCDLGEVDTEDHVPVWFLGGRSPGSPGDSGVTIEQVPSVLRLYADRRDPGAIARLVEEVHAAAIKALSEDGWGDPGEYLARVDTLLSAQRGIFGELVGRVLSGQLEDAAVGGALARAGEAVLGIAGRTRRPSCAHGPEVAQDVEILVVRHLTALCRLAGSAVREADQAHGADVALRPAALRIACANLQQAARWAIDPDPPGMKLPPEHPWRSGLSSAEGALVWLWGAAESPSGPYGVGLYALCEILTGRKFFDSYWEGHDVFTEIERRLSESDDGPIAGRSRATLERAGGLPRVSLELAATRLGATPPRGSTAAGAIGLVGDRDVACNLFLAGGGYKPAGRDPIEDLAWLLTDRLRGSLWTMVHEQLGRLPDQIVRPPLRPLHLDPAACALAVALRLAPMERGAGAEETQALRRFAEALPTPLLEQTAALASSLTDDGGDETQVAPDRKTCENALVIGAGFVRRLVPGLPPGLDAAPDGGSPEPGPEAVLEQAVKRAAPNRGSDDFEEVLRRIALAESRELEVDLIQCDTRWLEQWADLRSALDAELLAVALRGRCRVRRVVLYEIPGDADRRATRFHYRWTGALAAAVGCFEPSDAADGAAPRYQVRRLVLPYAGPDVAVPRDCAVLRGDHRGEPDPEMARAFERIWGLYDRAARVPARGLGLAPIWPASGPPGHS